MGRPRDMSQYAKIGFGERLAYGFGDFGYNFSYGAVATLYVFFLTDYIGIPPVYTGMIILVSRVFDGGSDILCGLLTKKTQTKWGRMRPWLMFLSIPFMISFVLQFTVPGNITLTAKCIYIFFVYNLSQTIFGTGINLPYSAMGNLMTRDQNQRAILQTFRLVIAPFGSLLASAFTLPLVKRMGDDQQAWIMVTSIWAVIGAATLLWTAFGCRERVTAVEGQDESTISAGKSIKLIFKNYYWWCGLLLWFTNNFCFATAAAAAAYYTSWIVKNTDWMIPVQVCERVSMTLAMVMIPFLVRKIGKRRIVMIGACIVIVGQLLIQFAGDLHWLLVVNALTRGVGVAGILGCVFIVLADTSEYALWKDGVRQDGMVYSAASIGAKLGGGLGGAAIGIILSSFNYDGMAAVQSAQALTGIRVAFVWPSLIVCLIAFVMMIPYKLDKLYPQIEKDLREREAAMATAGAGDKTDS